MHADQFLQALAIVLGVAALTTLLFQRLRQPVVLGYLLAGLIVGPHVPIPLVADPAVVRSLSEFGVILLMFSLGLEFSLRRLAQAGSAAVLTAVIECSFMLWVGYLAGRALGWSHRASLFVGAVTAISSTTIIAKAFEELRIGGRFKELVVSILVVEDLIAVLLVAALTAITVGGDVSTAALLRTGGRLALFLVILVGAGLLLVPRAVRLLTRHGSAETILVSSIGFCFGVALLAMKFGYSVALGAFLAGTLVAESGEGHRVARLVRPVRDMFAAVFFVSVGMLIEPSMVQRHWGSILALTAVVLAGKMLAVSTAGFLSGHGVRPSVQAGMSMAQIGEFSFIIASLGLALGTTGSRLYASAVAVCALTTLATPWLIRASGPTAARIDGLLPRPLQTFAALYGNWVERLYASPQGQALGHRLWRLGRVLLLDAGAVALIAVMGSAYAPDLAAFLQARSGLALALGHVPVAVLAAAAALPFLLGIVRISRALGAALSGAVFPPAAAGAPDLAQAPRKAMVTAVQLVLTLLIGLPLLALTQPFLHGWQAGAVLLVLLVLLSWAFWRHAADLQGHVRAGSQMLAEAVQRGMEAGAIRAAAAPDLESVPGLLRGLGDPVTVRLSDGCRACGQSLAGLQLRGATGATVLVIVRRDGSSASPSAAEKLEAGDTLVLAGTHEAISAAKDLLLGQGLPGPHV